MRPMLPADPSADVAPARASATVVVLRDGRDGPEALMLRRHGRSGFAARAWVFPGGVVDAADRSLDAARWTGIDPYALAPRFGDPPDVVLGYHVAAVRETFEEAGLLLTTAPVDPADDDAVAMRRALVDRQAGGSEFASWLRGRGLVLDLGRLTYWSRWVTPAQEPKRYDTPFFLARAPLDQVAVHDAFEITDQRWIRPQAALDAHAAGNFPMIYPTIRNLEEMAAFGSVDALVAHAEARPDVRSIQPHIELDTDGGFVRVVHPDDAEYPHEQYAERAR